jgi:hypothetical protein
MESVVALDVSIQCRLDLASSDGDGAPTSE